MQTSKQGIDLIKKFEGCVLKVYLDAVNVKTVGYGHTGPDVNAMAVGTPITQDQAEEYLKKDLIKFEMRVEWYDPIYKWTQNEFDALVSFAYNIGSIDQLTERGARSKEVIAEKMLAYNKAGGRVLSGLTKRRQTEHDLFVKGYNDQTATYGIGNVYTLQSNMYVRSEPNGSKLKYDALTIDAKKHAHFDTEGHAILDKGTRVTCKALTSLNGQIWMKIPSGWICAKGEKVYVK